MGVDTNSAFLGRGWDFPPTFSKDSKTVEMVSDVEDINSCLEILLSTQPGERQMHPKFGMNMQKLLFEPLDTTLEAYMQLLIKKALLFFEPRIRLIKIELIPDQHNGLVNIILEYYVLSTNSRYNYVYPYYITEGTNIAL